MKPKPLASLNHFTFPVVRITVNLLSVLPFGETPLGKSLMYRCRGVATARGEVEFRVRCPSMQLVEVLPAVNATLNATSGACLLTGYVLMRRRRIKLHRRFM